MSNRRAKNILVSLTVAVIGYFVAFAAGVGTGVAFIVAVTVGALGELSVWVQILRWLRGSGGSSPDPAS